MRQFWKQPLSLAWFATILSIFNLLAYNIPFFRFVVDHAEMGTAARVFLVTTLVLVLLALHFCIFYLLLYLLRIVGRILLAIFFALSGTCTYFVLNYHNLMDESMMGNVFNTRYSEASAYFTWSLWLFIVLMGILPALYILLRKVEWGTWKRFGIATSSSLLVGVVLVLINLNQVLWIGKYDTELGGLIMPWSYTVNTCRLFSHRADAQQEEILLPDAHFRNQDKEAVVLVIGESARRANFQLYGYNRETNPCLSKMSDLQVYKANSCATYTTAGVKAILEHQPSNDLYEILPNYLYRTGADVIWRTSNWGEPPVHIKEYQQRAEVAESNGAADLKNYDGALMAGVVNRVKKSTSNKVLVVLHTSTSHGPDYQMQYPKAMEYFTPVCDRVEDAQKQPDRLRNAYDNSIRYTDACLTALVDSLRTLEGWKTAVLYVSDHGESLGENGLYMHGVPLKMAPREQYEIPFLLWLSPGYRQVKIHPDLIDQHYVYHTVLNLLSVESPIYNPNLDLLMEKYK